jgi:hypothetical protein
MFTWPQYPCPHHSPPAHHSPHSLCSEGRDLLLRNYRRGRKIHWSGFSSASPSREVALQFAGAGGVLLRLDLLPEGSCARDIRDLSALRGEEEASDCIAPTRGIAEWFDSERVDCNISCFACSSCRLEEDGIRRSKEALTKRVGNGCGEQVLLLPNFTTCVTHEIYVSDDGFDTIDLLEQVGKEERELIKHRIS